MGSPDATVRSVLDAVDGDENMALEFCDAIEFWNLFFFLRSETIYIMKWKQTFLFIQKKINKKVEMEVFISLITETICEMKRIVWSFLSL